MEALLFSTHPDESAVLSVILQQAGFTVRSIRDLSKAMEQWPQQPFELIMIVLEEARPETVGKMKQIRAHTVVPIVVIVDTLPEDKKILLVEAGVDLIAEKPYGVRYLQSQIKALLRRSVGLPFFSLPILSKGNLLLNPANRSVAVGDNPPKRLTQLEFRLLFLLMNHVDQIIPTETIVEHVWGYAGEGNRELVRGLVQRLRSKIEPEPHQPRYIMTESGIGYYFNRFEE